MSETAVAQTATYHITKCSTIQCMCFCILHYLMDLQCAINEYDKRRDPVILKFVFLPLHRILRAR